MRQIGKPPKIDSDINAKVKSLLSASKFKAVDATSTTASKDYLERIIGLVRATGFTVAIFSEETRPDTMANIALELGFAAMSGKPLIICKSKEASAPSDLKRTDWIEYDPAEPKVFAANFRKALAALPAIATLQRNLIAVALAARSIDCAVALERCNKGFLLTGEKSFNQSAQRILKRVEEFGDGGSISDLDRLKADIMTFVRQASESIA